ncbi:MAG: stress response translation initiation inhibitor YciH [Candidatus Aenigmarchaeota archaeon]|nr:stress response translation initiation inhibitor YciH [Candidatus Aenigmarchaeota archaeon]
MVCPKCGLPEELCVCEVIAKEVQKIKITFTQKRYGKYVTIIRGIDPKKIDLKELMRKLKSKLACGGTYKNGEIELQGDHRERVKKILIEEGFQKDIIEVA